MRSPFEQQLTALVRQPGVLACLVVGESDGIIVDTVAQSGVDEHAVAALAASLFRRARLSARAAGLGAVGFLELEAECGHICATGRDELVLVALTELRAPLGRLRGSMLQLAETLA
ncbi:MAG TPA: roadblock/LC7 domain-containing protein [Gemmatimonadaceae bacterium]|nr:roadblock/LC7 domain-containing protein [Gemmatimonadaceae bacterium]